MTTAAPSTALATIQPAFTDPARLCLAGVPGCIARPDPRGHALDLRGTSSPSGPASAASPLSAVRRADIESSPAIAKTGAGPARP